MSGRKMGISRCLVAGGVTLVAMSGILRAATPDTGSPCCCVPAFEALPYCPTTCSETAPVCPSGTAQSTATKGRCHELPGEESICDDSYVTEITLYDYACEGPRQFDCKTGEQRCVQIRDDESGDPVNQNDCASDLPCGATPGPLCEMN